MRSIRNFLLFPIFFTNVAIQLSLWFFSSAVLAPSVALLWRTRRYLADASAVQMTRNPDGLAGALKKLNDDGGAIPGGGWAAHLFIVSPSHSDQTASDRPTAQHRQTSTTQSAGRVWYRRRILRPVVPARRISSVTEAAIEAARPPGRTRRSGCARLESMGGRLGLRDRVCAAAPAARRDVPVSHRRHDTDEPRVSGPVVGVHPQDTSLSSRSRPNRSPESEGKTCLRSVCARSCPAVYSADEANKIISEN